MLIKHKKKKQNDFYLLKLDENALPSLVFKTEIKHITIIIAEIIAIAESVIKPVVPIGGGFGNVPTGGGYYVTSYLFLLEHRFLSQFRNSLQPNNQSS